MSSLIVIGASAGGVSALTRLLGALPADLAAAVCVVLHIGAWPSRMPELVQRVARLPVGEARDGEPLRAGHIYFAPPDRHLRIAGARLDVSRGPKENLARPAIDPLFRSAAESWGAGAIGVVLTGLLDDGTAGLHAIKRGGGVAVVQDPRTAEQPEMPRSAIAHVAVDHVVTLEDMGPLLARLAAERVRAAVPEAASMNSGNTLETPVALVCPDCGGAMRRLHEVPDLGQFGCHIGHRMTGHVLAAEQVHQLEQRFDAIVRLLNERRSLLRELRENVADGGDAVAEWTRAEAQTLQTLEGVLALSRALPRTGEDPAPA